MSSRTTYPQFLALVEFMEKNGDLSRVHNLPQGRLWGFEKWKELTDLLNNLGSQELRPSKPRSEEKWRKVWSDLKNNTKRKWARINSKVTNEPGPKLYMTDVEHKVISLLYPQAAVKVPLAEVSYDLVEESTEEDRTNSVSEEVHADDLIIIKIPETPIVGDEDWNIPGSSKDPGPISPVHSAIPPQKSSTPNPISPPKSPIALNNETSTHSPPPSKQRKRTLSNILEDYALKCDENISEDKSDRKLSFLHLESERIRQRDIELRQRDTELLLQAQWLELMKAGLNVLDRYLNGK